MGAKCQMKHRFVFHDSSVLTHRLLTGKYCFVERLIFISRFDKKYKEILVDTDLIHNECPVQ